MKLDESDSNTQSTGANPRLNYATATSSSGSARTDSDSSRRLFTTTSSVRGPPPFNPFQPMYQHPNEQVHMVYPGQVTNAYQNYVTSNFIQRQRPSQLKFERTEKEPEWNEFESCLLASLVGFFATQVQPRPDGCVTVHSLPWDYISAYLMPVQKQENSTHSEDSSNSSSDESSEHCISYRSPSSCKAQWMKQCPGSYFLRTSTGVYLCHDDEDFPSETDSSEDCYIEKPVLMYPTAPDLRQFQGSFHAPCPPRNLTNQRKPRKNWTDEEHKQISSLQKQYGNKWTKISAMLGNHRTPKELKNYWHHRNRKKKPEEEEVKCEASTEREK